MKNRRVNQIGWLCLAFIWAASGIGVGQELSPRKLAASHYDFVLNPETGGLAAIEPEANLVTLYQAEYLSGDASKKIGPLKVGNTPSCIIYKKYKNRGVFIIGCLKDAQLYVVDATKLTLIKQIPLQGDSVVSLAASLSPTDPYIYYCYRRPSDDEIGRVSLATLADQGKVLISARDCAISADGKLLFRRGNFNPSGFECLKIVEGAGEKGGPRLDRVFYDHTDSGPYVIDPAGVYTAAGHQVYTLDLKKRIGQTSILIACFFPNKGVIVGQQGNQVRFASRTTLQETGFLRLPQEFISFEETDAAQLKAQNQIYDRALPPDLTARPIRTFADAKSDRVVVARGDKVLVIPVDSQRLPEEIILQAKLLDTPQFEFGKLGKVRVELSDPRIKLAISKGPKGLTIANNALEWTPTDDQIGVHPVQLSLKHGESEATTDVDLEVARAHARLDFDATGLQVSNDGKFAVCWRSLEGGMFRPPVFGAAAPEEAQSASKIAVVDLTALKVVATAALPFPIRCAGIDKDHVFVSSDKTNAVMVFSKGDFTRKKQLSTDSPPMGMTVLADKFLYVLSQKGVEHLFSLPALTPNEIPATKTTAFTGIPSGFSRHNTTPATIGRLKDGWLMYGLCFDDDLKNVRMVSATTSILRYDGIRGMLPPPEIISVAPGVGTIGREGAAGFSDALVAKLENEPAAVSLAAYRNQEQLTPQTWRQAITLQLGLSPKPFEPILKRVTLAKFNKDQPPQGTIVSQDPGKIQCVGDRVVALFENQLFVADITKLDREQFPDSLQLQCAASSPIISSKEPTVLPHKATGGASPVTYTLLENSNQIKIDPATASITVNGPAILEEILAKLKFDPAAAPVQRDRNSPFTSTVQLDIYRQNCAAEFEQISGKKPAEVPFAVPIQIRARDAEGKTAELSYFAFVEAPYETLASAIKKREAEIQENLKRSQELAIEQQKQMESERKRQQDTTGDISKRVEALEKKFQDLEAKIDLLIKLMQERPKP